MSTEQTLSQKKRNYRWLMQQSAIGKFWLSLSTFFGISSGILIILQAAILAHIIDHVYLHQATIHDLTPSLWLLCFIILGRTAIAWLKEITSYKTADLIKTRIRLSLLENLLAKNTDTLNKQKTGALVTTIIEKVETIHGFFADYLPQMTIVIVIPTIILAITFTQNILAGFILLITAPLIPLFMALIGMGVESLNQRHFQSLSRLSAHFLDLLQGLSTLSLFNVAQTQSQSIEKKSEAYRKKTMDVLRIAFLSSAMLELFSTLSIAIIAVYLGLGLLGLVHFGFGHTGINLQSAFFILLLAPEFFMPLRQLGTFYHARSEAIAAATELQKTYANNKFSDQASLAQPTINEFTLTLKNITFAYPKKTSIFTNFNHSIYSGDIVAITGPSGAGKSTLLKLIAKLQIPEAGEILFNEYPLSQINTDFWHKKISILVQNPYLFHATIFDNIALGQTNISTSKVTEAAQLADVLSFANTLPNGLNTLIGEQRLGLSGGQAQRVALARAYLKNAPIILLDEPTAHLDSDSKSVIYQAINDWRGKKTIIIATHDEALIQLANSIIALI